MLKTSLIVTLVVASIAGTNAQIHMGPQALAPARIDLPEGGTRIPMQDMGGRPVVGLMINGRGPYRFVLDTGATTTIISDELSRELSLTPPAGMQAASPSGGKPPAIVAVHEIRLGGATLEGMIVVAMPLSHLLVGENPPRGILSAASFPGFLLTYDYPSQQISIKKGALGDGDSQNIFQYPEDADLPTVPIRIAGRTTQVHLDTGSGFGLTLPTSFLTELPLASQPTEGGTARTIAGEFKVLMAPVRGPIELGRYKLNIDKIRFSDARPGPKPAIGNIGSEILRNFVVTLDSKNRRVEIRERTVSAQ